MRKGRQGCNDMEVEDRPTPKT
ncbi:unnamed protein product, partial [Didymodactylos carnosus]